VSPVLAPLDVHAHVEPGIASDELRALRAVVVAVTRKPAEWDEALVRTDPTTLWSIGVHLGVSEALETFDDQRFRASLERITFIGEVGLDGRADTDFDRQRDVLDCILKALGERPRPLTIHSTSASRDVLDALRARPSRCADPALVARHRIADTHHDRPRLFLLDKRPRGSQAARARPDP
jgi:TatD DNase family protein